MLTVLLVENDPILAMDLALRLTQMGFRVLGAVDTGNKALEIYQKHTADLILLNISLSGPDDGIDVAEQLQQIRRSPFIFLTNRTDRAVLDRSRQAGPAAYIAMPFSDITLRIAMDLALQTASGVVANHLSPALTDPTPESLAETGQNLLYVNDAVFIKQNYRFVKFHLNDVLYMQSEGNYTDIITKAKKYTIRLVLNKVLEKIQSPDIIRNHRSYAVNLRQIQSFGEQGISVGTHTVPVGRSYRESFVKRFTQLEDVAG